MAHMVPTSKDVNRSEFAGDNFTFCITKLIDASIALMLSPVLSIFNSQLNATAPIQESMNSLKTSASSLVMGPITSLFGFMWKKLGGILYQIIRIYTNLHSSFDRVFGITLSSLFAGISMFKGIQNSINFIIKVCIIILIIIMALMIIMFFALLPLMPVIMTTIGIIAATAYGASVNGMGFCDAGDENCRKDSFCVAPGTLVATFEGWKPVESLRCGENLDKGVVEGILKVQIRNPKLVDISGVIVAETHLVYDTASKTWIPASESAHAKPYTHGDVDTLYCLNTSNRMWRVKCADGSLLLRDWEELPTEPTIDALWEKSVYLMLNPAKKYVYDSYPGRGLLGPATFVTIHGKGRIHLEDVCIGDHITCSSGYTKVIGVYVDTSEKQPSSGPNPAIWTWQKSSSVWAHPYRSTPAISSVGYHLVTESGTFFIDVYDSVPILVRDFTEVGYDRIDETYAFVLSRLNVRNDEAHDVSY